MRLRLILLALTGAVAPLGAVDVEAGLAYFRDLAETRSFTLGRPVSPQITPDGRTVFFLRSGPRDPTQRLYEYDLTSQREREVLTPARLLAGGEEKLSAEEKARRERQRQSLKGFTTFQLSHDGTRLLVTLSGQLYVLVRDPAAASGSDLPRIVALPGKNWIDPRFSPDGHFVAAAGPDRELHVIDVATTREHAVTSGATETLSHGTAEFVAQEEMSRFEGFWWAPDSQSLLCQETDESQVEVRYVADPLQPSTAPTKFFYPRAGTPNATVRLFLVARQGGERRPVPWDPAAFPYLAGVRWPERAPLTLLVQNRAQTEERLLAVDVSTGATRELLRETDAAWLNLDDSAAGSTGSQRPPFWFKDGSHFLWTTERRGSWQVELHAASGALLRQLTPLTWNYRGLVGLDEDNGGFYVRGGDDPLDVHVWKFPLGDGAPVRLTRERGQHGAAFFEAPRLLIRTVDGFDGDNRCEVVSATDARVVATLPSVAATPTRWPRTELLRTGPLGFDTAITRPVDFSSTRKYPVILHVYAGPTSKHVSSGRRTYFPDQWMADQGYVVVRLDGRGTPWRGRDWERAIQGNFIDVALNDQIAGLQSLARTYPELDLARVGVTGWSFGGYFSAMAVLRRPDIFRAGAAGAPVVTWENYDTHYTERYLGLPQAAPDAYRISDVTTYAAAARRPLLLIHGLTDDNVYFQHTLQLADALYMAGKPYELLPMLGTHLVSDPLVRLRQQVRIIDFFNRELALEPVRSSPPQEIRSR